MPAKKTPEKPKFYEYRYVGGTDRVEVVIEGTTYDVEKGSVVHAPAGLLDDRPDFEKVEVKD